MNMQDKFRGAMVGGVIGDCLGSPLEFKYPRQGMTGLPHIRHDLTIAFPLTEPFPYYQYTDDTAMARQIAWSIIHTKGHINAKDMSKRFVDEFYDSPNRGYGRNVCSVFRKLHEAIYVGAMSHIPTLRKQNNDKKDHRGRPTDDFDPFLPARKQFNGTGSYGNGAAMRVHPVALSGISMSPEELAAAVRETAQITHAHESGIRGAVLQALAVQLSLKSESELSEEKYLGSLRDMVHTFDESDVAEQEDKYEWSMSVMETALQEKDVSRAYDLGNDVSAQRSVPSAIFSFLRAHKAVKELAENKDMEGADNFFKKTLFLAYSFGGDADTIGSMAGAIAGAQVGLSRIPKVYQDKCEGIKDAIKQADELFEMVFPREASK